MWNIILAISILFTGGGLIFLLVLGLLHLRRKGAIVLESASPAHRTAQNKSGREIDFWNEVTLRLSVRDRNNQKIKLTNNEWRDKKKMTFPDNLIKIDADAFDETAGEIVIKLQSLVPGTEGMLKIEHAHFKPCIIKFFALSEKPKSTEESKETSPSAQPPAPPPTLSSSPKATEKEEIINLQPNVLQAPPTSDKPFLKGAEEIKKALDEMEKGIEKIRTSPPDKVTQLIQSMLCILSLIKVKLQEQADALHAAEQQGDKQMDSFRAELQKLDAEIRKIEIRITGITVAPTAPPPPPVASPPPVIVQPSIPREENNGWLITASIFVFACAVATFVYIATIQV